MDSTAGQGGLLDVGKAGSSIVDASALPMPGDFSWDHWGARTAATSGDRGVYSFQIASVRPYDRGVSPNIFVDSPWPNTTATGGGQAAYQWTPANRSWISGYSGWWAAECTTSSPHGLKTGHTITVTGQGTADGSGNPGPGQLLLQGGSSGGTALAPAFASLRTAPATIFVTGPSSFVLLWLGGSSSVAAQYADNVQTAYCTQSTTYNSIGWIDVSTGGTGYTGSSNPPMVAIDPPTSGWQTATAKVVIGSPAGSGTVSVNTGSSAATFSSAPANFAGQVIQITGDSSAGVYTVSGTGPYTISPAYGGASNAVGAGWTYYYGIVSVTPTGNNGNHYAFTPNCTIVGGGIGTGAAVTANAPVGGAITGYTVTSPGSNYNAFVGLQVDPPGTTATASPTISGGAVTALTVVSGGSGYVTAPEVIVTGDGTGASYTATIAGGVVTGFTKNSGGTGYTQAIASIALPPTQATGFVRNITSGAVDLTTPGTSQSGMSIIWGGTGYGASAPAVTLTGGGASVQATAVAVPVYPATATLKQPGDGTIPYEAACAVVAALPGCAFYCNIPPFASDAAVSAIANRVLAALPAGHKVYVQLGNELWNSFFTYHWIVFGALAGGLPDNQAGAARSAQVHDIFATVFANAGRGGDIVRLFGGWYGNGGLNGGATAGNITYANAHNKRVDAVVTAPYIEAASFGGTLDPMWVTAAASCASGLASSTQHGTAWPWTMLDYHTLWRHHLIYSASYQAAFAADSAALAAYSVPGYPTPQLIAYEGGIEDAIPPGVGTGGGNSAPRLGLTHDFFYDPSMKDTVATWHLMCAQRGMTATCYMSAVAMPGGASTNTGDQLWCLANYAGQQAGLGDGSDGLATNQFYVTDQKSHYLGNVSPALAGFQAFGQAINPAPITASSARKWYPGLRRLSTALVR
jgi:hypothetical protein